MSALFPALLACTPYGSELTDTLSPEDSLDAENGETLADDELAEVERIYGEDEDRERAVEVHDQDLRCMKGARSRELQVVGEDGDPNFAPETGIVGIRRAGKILALPLQHTSFDTVVVGTVAETEIVQTFANPLEDPIEAVYLFPLHEHAAVDDYWMTIGERTIRGQMKTREDARETYDAAKRDGRAAGLLEQQRPNSFTQSIANIPPGESIEITMHLVQPLEQVDGRYSLVLPTVVGPRFVPGTPSAGAQAGPGPALDTKQVPDASAITAPLMPEGMTSCADLEVHVALESGLRPYGLRSRFHDVDIQRDGDRAFIQLDADSEGAPVVANRDFILSWDLGRAQPKAAIVAQPDADGQGGYFTLTVQPPKQVADEQAVARELVFVVDNSGSMGGQPMATAKALMRKALAGMRPGDTFTVLRFSEAASGLSDDLLAATPENVARGLDYVDGMRGMGGTQMTEGIRAALSVPHDPDRLRVVMFLTDGYIGNEAEIFRLVDKQIGDARLFSLGVGSAPNRYLLEGMASVGRGAVTYAGTDEDIEPVVERFYERVATPVLTDVEIDWQGLAVSEVLPGKIPDLFAGQPITVFGRYQGAPAGDIVIKARAKGQTIELPARFDLAKAEDVEGVSSVWARGKIDALSSYPHRADSWSEADPETKQAIIDIALQHRVMTEFTSFVAVDQQRVVEPDGTVRTVLQPLEVPEGTAYDNFVGEAYGVGGLGLVGAGRGGGGGSGAGYGSGSGTGFGGRGKRVPRIRQAKASVTGNLDKDVIRRIVRAHVNEVRACYETGLSADPSLTGTVEIRFEIDATGKVTSATVASNDSGDEALGQCVAKAAGTWKFPKPAGGGSVTVTYPFKLSPG
ncbi:TonB family protein [Pseudenhygromyxa sp. WMMC2535]|uniref:TonB family protein n=1 Tax=Pseudenhygromyxa sp. WMMC2535 TaxID=2712867 RepID=UPI001556DB26|nr:TonB family protein [Pseudenhygromyxa sp. WMMC2535]NVB37749.1 TonB family protein [Pseudenhygromyxa sp. WMMC2535]